MVWWANFYVIIFLFVYVLMSKILNINYQGKDPQKNLV